MYRRGKKNREKQGKKPHKGGNFRKLPQQWQKVPHQSDTDEPTGNGNRRGGSPARKKTAKRGKGGQNITSRKKKNPASKKSLQNGSVHANQVKLKMGEKRRGP